MDGKKLSDIEVRDMHARMIAHRFSDIYYYQKELDLGNLDEDTVKTEVKYCEDAIKKYFKHLQKYFDDEIEMNKWLTDINLIYIYHNFYGFYKGKSKEILWKK